MQLWHWLLLFGLVFLITYNPRTGNLGKFFDAKVPVEDESSRATQSDSNTHERSE